MVLEKLVIVFPAVEKWKTMPSQFKNLNLFLIDFHIRFDKQKVLGTLRKIREKKGKGNRRKIEGKFCCAQKIEFAIFFSFSLQTKQWKNKSS